MYFADGAWAGVEISFLRPMNPEDSVSQVGYIPSAEKIICAPAPPRKCKRKKRFFGAFFQNQTLGFARGHRL